MTKYHSKKTVVNGITFDSKKEAARYAELMILRAAGKIQNLKLQEEFTLQNGFTTPQGERIRPITYRADFTYTKDGQRIVEDVKGYKTKEYLLKKKLMAGMGYQITEV